MGKVLIIKGADFSQVRLYTKEEIEQLKSTYFGIEFERNTPNQGGTNGYHKMIGNPNNISMLDKIKPCIVKDGTVVGFLNPTNWNKYEDGREADLSGADGSDVMIYYPKMYAILGGTNEVYERWIYSLKPFTYEGDTAELIEAFAEAPDNEIVVDNKSRSICTSSYNGNKGNLSSAISDISTDTYNNAAGFPSTLFSRYFYEQSASKKGPKYTNANVLDWRVIYGLMYIEFRTKNLNSLLSHGISNNIMPSDENWGTVSGVRLKTDTNTYKYYYLGTQGPYVGETSKTFWDMFCGSNSLTKVMEFQKAISDNGNVNFTPVKNSDGDDVSGYSKNTMTGIYKKEFTFKITCALTKDGEEQTYDAECVLVEPIWRGKSHLYGNTYTYLSGADVAIYTVDGVVHIDYYEANNLSSIHYYNDNESYTDLSKWSDGYTLCGNLGSTSGWCQSSYIVNGRSSVVAHTVDATSNTYECAYTYVAANNNLPTPSPRAVRFGGITSTCCVRSTNIDRAPSWAIDAHTSRFRVVVD